MGFRFNCSGLPQSREQLNVLPSGPLNFTVEHVSNFLGIETREIFK